MYYRYLIYYIIALGLNARMQIKKGKLFAIYNFKVFFYNLIISCSIYYSIKLFNIFHVSTIYLY